MRKSMVVMLAAAAMVASGCLIWTTAQALSQSGGTGGDGQPGGGAGGRGGGFGGQPGGGGFAKKRPMGFDGGVPGGAVAAVMNRDPAEVFDLFAKGRDFFLISEARSLRDPLTKYAQEKGILNGQITRAQFREFHTQYAKLQGEGGNKKKPKAFGGGTSWEYRVQTRRALAELGKDNFEAGLNSLGAEGWELVGIETNKASLHAYIFRRPGTAKPKAEKKPDAAPKQKAEEKIDFHIYRLKHANAVNVARVLEELLRTGRGDPVRIVADPDTNQLLLRGPMQVQLDVAAILERLDQEPAGPGPGPQRGNRFPPGK